MIGMGGGGGGVQPLPPTDPAYLRQGMGNRIYPMENAALAGLRKAY
jgi:hypothetical protein